MSTKNQDEAEQEPNVSKPDTPTLEAQLIAAQKQVAEIRQAHTEAAAEFEKTKERLERHHSEEINRAKQKIATGMFEVADNLNRVIDAIGNGGTVESISDGIKMVRDQFFVTLGQYGIQQMGAKGAKFDPTRHEAVSTIPVEDAAMDGKIIEVLTPGYTAGNTVLRAAVVVVGKAPKQESA